MSEENLFGDIFAQNSPEDNLAWKKEWRSMPEFNQNDLEPEFQIIVSFKNEQDMLDFGRLVNQKISFRTRSIWHPAQEIDNSINELYIDEP